MAAISIASLYRIVFRSNTSFSNVELLTAISLNSGNDSKILDTLSLLKQSQFVTAYGIALVHAGMGDSDSTFKWLNKAYDERSNWLVWLKTDPRWESIRTDERYAELVRKVGLPE